MAQIKYENLIQQLSVWEEQQTAHPALFGGAFEARHIDGFLKLWKDDVGKMPWRLWEFTSSARFGHQAEFPASDEMKWLERGCLFGEGGDLELRRDGDVFYWRFVGPDDAALPEGVTLVAERPALAANLLPAKSPEATPPEFRAADYWATPKDGEALSKLQRDEQCVLLWGERREGKGKDNQSAVWWHEDRVAGVRAPLDYRGLDPKLAEAARVQLKQWVFRRGEQIEAVWRVGLVPWQSKEDCHAKG